MKKTGSDRKPHAVPGRKPRSSGPLRNTTHRRGARLRRRILSRHAIRALDSYGGVLQTAALKGRLHPLMTRVLREYVDHVRNFLDTPPLARLAPITQPVRIAFTGDLQVNALSIAVDVTGERIIAFSGGLLAQLPDTFLRLLSHPEVFPEIGAPSGPTDKPLSFLNLKDVQSHGHKAAGSTRLFDQLPSDATRIYFAMNLTFFALVFLFFHELAHIGRGHLEIGGQGAAVRARREVPERSALATSPAERARYQAIEFDADRSAVQLSLAEITFLKGKGREGPAYVMANLAPDLQHCAWLFAAAILFMIFERQEPSAAPGGSPSSVESRTHPSPEARALTVTAVASVARKKRSQEGFLDGWRRAREAWARFELPPLPPNKSSPMQEIDNAIALLDGSLQGQIGWPWENAMRIRAPRKRRRASA